MYLIGDVLKDFSGLGEQKLSAVIGRLFYKDGGFGCLFEFLGTVLIKLRGRLLCVRVDHLGLFNSVS